jgi:4-diphosphocytidyl-2-C-methyl-D-erythritol kinase
LNVYLAILGRRPDGYHELQTLMAPINVFDSLVLEPASADPGLAHGIRFSLVSPERKSGTGSLGARPREAQDVPPDETNLVVRALAELRRRTGCPEGAKVTLVKRIPAGAGLGGGSSDAAAALLAANRAWKLRLARHELTDIAATLGSDVPFFLTCRAAVCTRRGDAVTPVEHGTRLHMILATPPERLASADVYAALDAADWAANDPHAAAKFDRLVGAFRRGDVGTLRRLLTNGLERAALALRPSLVRVKELMGRVSNAGAVMTGSGSSFFCLCRTAREARCGAAYLRSLGLSSAISIASCG